MATMMVTKPTLQKTFPESQATLPTWESPPDWLLALKRSAAERLALLGLPTRQLDIWRYVDLDPILKQTFEPPARILSSRDLSGPHEAVSGPCLTFLNGYFIPEKSDLNGLPPEVIVGDLRMAWSRCPDLLQTKWTTTSVLDETDPFVLMNLIHFENGPFVYVPPDITVETPIRIRFLSQADLTRSPMLIAPRGLVVLGAGAKATCFVESSVLGTQTPHFTLPVMTLCLEDAAALEWVTVQNEGSETFFLGSTTWFLAADSQGKQTAVTLGGKISRQALTVNFMGKGASCELNGLALLHGAMRVHDHTVINHQVPGCDSQQFYKGILQGESQSEFNGTILIHREAQQSNASQLNKNLLLSENARVYTRPQLKIDADDVKCTHGATVGQLEEAERFYLQSRGIPQEMAQQMLTLGFAEEVLDRIVTPMPHMAVSRMVQSRLRSF